jgi:hypothetical protein
MTKENSLNRRKEKEKISKKETWNISKEKGK